jgi:hypothetical protein
MLRRRKVAAAEAAAKKAEEDRIKELNKKKEKELTYAE